MCQSSNYVRLPCTDQDGELVGDCLVCAAFPVGENLISDKRLGIIFPVSSYPNFNLRSPCHFPPAPIDSCVRMSSSSQGDLPFKPPSSSTTSTSTPRSGSHTPQQKPANPYTQAASYFSYPVSHVVSGLYRRLTDPNIADNAPSATMPWSTSSSSEVFTPRRTASPFQPPPLTPITLDVPHAADLLQQQLLTRALAEEIRLLVPPRLQLVETWRLAYSLDRDGASLSTLYDNCEQFSHRSPRAGYVLVIRDSSPTGAVFGAYMTDVPQPHSQFFGTGECFLWRASVLPPPATTGMAFAGDGPQSEEALERAGLPPPPSADTTHAGRGVPSAVTPLNRGPSRRLTI